jgi:hypothetical protein
MWALVLTLTLVGGIAAWVSLGTGLCEGSGSSGSDLYCNRGGWEASGFGLGAAFFLAGAIPAAAVAVGSRRWFWIGLIAPAALSVIDVVLSATLGTH